jgi:hypothetical protein
MFTVRGLVAVGLVVVASGCAKTSSSPPVANVTFSANVTKVAIGSPVDLTYKFDVLPNAAITGDYLVFVHVVDVDGEMMWTDDHEPPVKTSLWKPGQTIGPYTRTRFVPKFPYSGPASVVIGLYKRDGGERLALSSAIADPKLEARHEYRVGQLEIAPANDTIKPTSGWYDLEGDQKEPENRWRWTQKSAVLSGPNPKKDVTLYVEFAAPADLFTPPQMVTIVANSRPVTTFAANNRERQLRRIPITASQLGSADTVEIRIDVDRTFMPSTISPESHDPRTLGLRIYNVFVDTR